MCKVGQILRREQVAIAYASSTTLVLQKQQQKLQMNVKSHENRNFGLRLEYDRSGPSQSSDSSAK